MKRVADSLIGRGRKRPVFENPRYSTDEGWSPSSLQSCPPNSKSSLVETRSNDDTRLFSSQSPFGRGSVTSLHLEDQVEKNRGQNSLCDRCQLINLRVISEVNISRLSGAHQIAVLGLEHTWEPAKCALCMLFCLASETRPTRTVPQRVYAFNLHQLDSRGRGPSGKVSPVVLVVAAPDKPRSRGGVSALNRELSLVRGVIAVTPINVCDGIHGQIYMHTVNQTRANLDSYATGSLIANLTTPGHATILSLDFSGKMNLIDCFTKTIVTPIAKEQVFSP